MAIPLSYFKNLKQQTGVVHGITTREGGVSDGNYATLNLGAKAGDNPADVAENRIRLAGHFGISSTQLFFPDQCHTSYVRQVCAGSGLEDFLETDALITNEPDIALAVLAADCVPILLFEPMVGAIAAVHAGWKGTAGRIVARTIEQMVKRFRARPANILAGIGPSISQKNYEVGYEVVEQFKFWFEDVPEIFALNTDTGKTHIDLWEANRQLLLRYGVPAKNIEVSGICTYENPDNFFSARRDGFHSGRFATLIMLTS